MEIEIKDFSQARDTASNIHSTAQDILNIFDEIDRAMTDLYGDTWQSSGADVSNGRYRELKANYDLFYKKIEDMHTHINTITNRDQTTDRNVGNTLA